MNFCFGLSENKGFCQCLNKAKEATLGSGSSLKFWERIRDRIYGLVTFRPNEVSNEIVSNNGFF